MLFSYEFISYLSNHKETVLTEKKSFFGIYTYEKVLFTLPVFEKELLSGSEAQVSFVGCKRIYKNGNILVDIRKKDTRAYIKEMKIENREGLSQKDDFSDLSSFILEIEGLKYGLNAEKYLRKLWADFYSDSKEDVANPEEKEAYRKEALVKKSLFRWKAVELFVLAVMIIMNNNMFHNQGPSFNYFSFTVDEILLFYAMDILRRIMEYLEISKNDVFGV